MKTVWQVILVVFILAVLTRLFIFDTFIVRGDSMAPSILPGDYILINKYTYRSHEPARGDIVVASPNDLNGAHLIKRIIAIPGETIDISKDQVVIRFSREDAGDVLQEPYIANIGMPEIGINHTNVDPFEYFVMGDNRYASIDSRELGSINSWDIKGKVILTFRWRSFQFKAF